MAEIDDCRKKQGHYELTAILVACLTMFLCKAGSRNQQNQHREEKRFRKNYRRLFGFEMPHGDTVNNVMALLGVEQIELLKVKLISHLISRKTFYHQRYLGKWYLVAIDGSGAGSLTNPPDEQCLHRTSKLGKTTYFRVVLEARLVTENGFSISLATEWIENPEDGQYDKQDCERKAFIRLAAKIKKLYPRLPIVILADGLYPYDEFFNTCRNYEWSYAVTLKDGSLPSVWEEAIALQKLQSKNTCTQTFDAKGSTRTKQVLKWVTQIEYGSHQLNWIECIETKHCAGKYGPELPVSTRFVHVTNFAIEDCTAAAMSQMARYRWKIENEGFNTLKNSGYGMQHRYARKSYNATKNYFQFMQIAHMIHQLMLLNKRFKENFMCAKNHPTWKNLLAKMVGVLVHRKLDQQALDEAKNTPCQFRFAT